MLRVQREANERALANPARDGTSSASRKCYCAWRVCLAVVIVFDEGAAVVNQVGGREGKRRGET